MITAERVRELLSYDPFSGIFTWRVKWWSMLPGDRAGSTLTLRDGTKTRWVGIDGSRFYEHRLAYLLMTGEWPCAVVDHRNGNSLDNRWCNLRAATKRQNGQNRRGLNKNNVSGFIGVSFHKSRVSGARYCVTILAKKGI